LLRTVKIKTMVERKKRKQNQRNNRNQKRRISHDKINRDELVVYRILCPIDVVGGAIGKSGKVIKAKLAEIREYQSDKCVQF